MTEPIKVRPENNQIKNYKSILQEYLTKEEVQTLLKRSNWIGFLEVLNVWVWIVSAFVLVGIWTNIFTILIAITIVGAKQLGCAIIMHDASHYSLFSSKKLNDVIGNWFGAYPIIHNLQQYRPYHLQHHIATGTEEDPDINLTKGYPTTKVSMIRKFSRDLSGISGIKGYYGIFAMHLGILRYNLGNYIERIIKQERGYLWQNAWKNLKGPVASNLLIFAICRAFGLPLLYLLWPLSMFTTHMFVLRVRSIAEHSIVDDRRDPLRNTRSIKANFIEKWLFAPLNVNYHLEHHLLFTVPSYNFKSMHKKLLERGLYKKANLTNGYWDIIKMTVKDKPIP